MPQQEIEIRTRDGVARAWVHRTGRATSPGVLFYPDVFGVRDTLHEMAGRLAALGFVVLVPDVFYRRAAEPTPDIATAHGDPAERERLGQRVRSITTDTVAADGGPFLDALVSQPAMRADRVGITGYCMGGRMAYLTAALFPDRVRAAASFHGGGFVTDAPDSPHRLAGRIRATLYFGVADEDRGCTPEHQGALARALAEADVEYRMELFRGKKHGYAIRDNARAYDREADERHWRRLEGLFAETLA